MSKRLSVHADMPRKRGAMVAAGAITTLLIAGLARMAAAQSAGAAGQAVPSALPPGPGHDTVMRVCSACHAPEIIAGQHLSPTEWKEMVDLMVRQGAAATEQEQAEIASYLTRSFPKSPASTEAPRPSN